MKSKYYTIAASIAACGLLVPTLAFADSGNTQELLSAINSGTVNESDSRATIVYTAEDKVNTFKVDPGESVGEALNELYLQPELVVDEEGQPLDMEETLKKSTKLLVFQIHEDANSTHVPIPREVNRIETDALPEGEVLVQEEGADGVMIKTVTKSVDLSKSKSSKNILDPDESIVETFTILKEPEERVVLVGTSGSSSGRGVDAPEQSIDVDAIAELEGLNKKNKAVMIALQQVGKRYVWGATGPDSFDCSGLMLYSFSKAGYSGLPRTSTSQGHASTPVKWSDIQPGDLIWRPGHVGMYVGKGVVVHAANPSRGVVTAPLSWFVNSGFSAGRFTK